MKFEDMDEGRREQVEKQVRAFEDRFTPLEYKIKVDIELAPDLLLPHYAIHKDVFQPDVMSSLDYARWLYYNNGEYYDKEVIEIGCGSGLQGIVTLLQGAKHVTFVDSDINACKNTLENLWTYGFDEKATIIQSDLFENVGRKADVILTNPPFFPSEPIEGKPVSQSMCFGEGKAEELYLRAVDYAPKIITCHWDFAGLENDPEVLGPRFGWNVKRRLYLPRSRGLQKITDEETYFKVDVMTR